MSGAQSSPPPPTIPRNLDQFSTWRYPASVRVVPQGATDQASQEIDLSLALQGARCAKDFDHNLYPYWSFTFMMTADEALRVQACWRSAKLYATFTRSYVCGTPGGSDQEVDSGQPWFTDLEFQIMTCPDVPVNVPKEGQGSDIARSAPRYGITMECVPTNSLHVNKSLNGGCYHGAAPHEIVAHLAQSNMPPGQYSFRMAPPDNSAPMESAVLPPTSFAHAVRYLDEVHGMYAGRLHVFLDHDVGHVLCSTKAVQPKPGGPMGVVVECVPGQAGSSEQTVGSGWDPKAMVYRLRTAVTPSLSQSGPAQQELHGEQSRVVGATPGATVVTGCSLVAPGSQFLNPTMPKQSAVWNRYSNPLTARRMEADARERYAPAQFHFDDPDVLAFDVSLRWRVMTADDSQTQAQGDYRLSAVEFVFSRAPGVKGPLRLTATCQVNPSSDGDPTPGM